MTAQKLELQAAVYEVCFKKQILKVHDVTMYEDYHCSIQQHGSSDYVQLTRSNTCLLPTEQLNLLKILHWINEFETKQATIDVAAETGLDQLVDRKRYSSLNLTKISLPTAWD